MNRQLALFTAIVMVASAGCAAIPSATQAIGGSRSDGTVRLAMTFTGSIIPNDFTMLTEQNRRQAAQRCAAWGYSDAEAFGEGQRACVAYVHDPLLGNFCTQTQITTTYQCTGGAQ